MGIDESQLDPQERKVYRRATALLEGDVDAPAFSARFFGPESELARLGTGREERRSILKSELYKWLKARYEELRLRDAGRFEKETRAASGRLTVVVPRSLHAALKSEAASEGVSLSELIRLKLAVPGSLANERLRPARSR